MLDSRRQTSLEDYIQVLRLTGTDGLPRILVGGQAIHAWAEYYVEAEPELCKFLPFLSKDIDLLGTALDLLMIERATGFHAVLAENRVFIPSAGYKN
ncbi:MAG: hypothetical protein HY360_02660 [Verrucomicrobia bacterium]|nr:hypothetical protein [Verrucomicrobiota bacterium]